MAGSTSKTIVIAMTVSLLLGACVFAADYFNGGKLRQSVVGESGGALAKVKLTAATVTVGMYATQNGGYTGLSAEAMSGIDKSTYWVDGQPADGQIGINDVTDNSYTLILKVPKGDFYYAIKGPGTLIFQDTEGNQL